MSLQRILAPFVDVRKEEALTSLLMFVYSFLAMTAYNIIQPLTRSKVIQSLGAVNVPWVILGSGLIISLLMVGYTRFVSALPRRWALPITQGLMAVAMLGFWFLFQDRRRLGLGRVLRVGRAARHPADQPVLDAGQRHLRSAPGQAAVRLRRRRRDAGRHDRIGADRADHRRSRHQRAAALERRHAAGLHAHRRDHPRPRAASRSP